ncbi:hypothetical protein L2E82_17414 [Cichorium intybus]|uniref:Uncharacterized protein n=1 Tax=Cichorium intybus TaxID=13427 RepID=A0ACB9F7N2_CICIN|nr:hypothetical protein L2E82_17414 [Cichorium intybus]
MPGRDAMAQKKNPTKHILSRHPNLLLLPRFSSSVLLLLFHHSYTPSSVAPQPFYLLQFMNEEALRF